MTRTTIRASQCQHILSYHQDKHFILPLVRLDRSRPLCPECVRYGVKVVEPRDNVLSGLYNAETGDCEMGGFDAVGGGSRDGRAAFPTCALPGFSGGEMSTLAFRDGPPAGTFGLGQQTQTQQMQGYPQAQIQTQAQTHKQATQPQPSTAFHQQQQQQQQPNYLASILSTYKQHHLDTYYPSPYPYAPSPPPFPSITCFSSAPPCFPSPSPPIYPPTSALSSLSLSSQPNPPPTHHNPFARPPRSMPTDTYFSTIRTIPVPPNSIRGNEGFLLQIDGAQRPFSAQDWANCVKMRMCETGATDYRAAERELWETIERVTRVSGFLA